MTVEAETSSYTYIGNGATSAFAFPSKFLSPLDVKVSFNGVAQLGGFTVTGAGNDTGGSVAFAVAPLSGVRVLLERRPRVSQLVDFVNGQTVLEGVLDSALDKLTMIAQAICRDVDRAVKVDAESAGPLLGPLLPGKILMAGANNTIISGLSLEDASAAASALAPTRLADDTNANSIVLRGYFIVTNPAGIPVTGAGQTWVVQNVRDVAGSGSFVQTAHLVEGGNPVETSVYHRRNAAGVFSQWSTGSGRALIEAPAWNSAVPYNAGAQVSRRGSIWGALVANLNKDPSISAEWFLIVGVTGGVLFDKLTLASSNAAFASISFGPAGVRPAVRQDGDVWTEANGSLWMRQNGVDKQVVTGSVSLPAGSVTDTAKATDNVARIFTGAASVIPFDNTPPLVTEGSALLSLNFSPKSATNRLRIEASIGGLSKLASGYVNAALFDGNTCIATNAVRVINGFDSASLLIECADIVAGSTANRTLSLRIGQDAAGGTVLVHGAGGGATFGATLQSVLKVTEFVG